MSIVPGSSEPHLSPSVLIVTAACKRFGKTQALDGAGFELRQGECLGLLGPNGAGKTTLIRAIAGRVRLDQGEILIRGEVLGNYHARSGLGMVPQEVALYPLLTARENLESFGTFCGLRRDKLRERVAWALQWTDLADRAGEPIKRFSGGMKRRLNIACGVLHRPAVVLLDEPTMAVDPQSRQRIWEMLLELRREGTSLLLTTHQMDEAQHICDRVVIIDHGRVMAVGTLTELVAQTVGPSRRVTVFLNAPLKTPLHSVGVECDGEDAVCCCLSDLGTELPVLLSALEAAGGRIRDLRIEAPGLQTVFLHLTGRELRE